MATSDEYTSDTSIEFRKMYEAKLGAMDPAEKIRRMCALSRMAAQFVCGGIRERYPAISHEELRIRYAASVCGREFVLRHFGWDSEKRGD